MPRGRFGLKGDIAGFDVLKTVGANQPWVSAMSWNETEILTARCAILKAAQDILAGTLTCIEGARRIVATAPAARLHERDVDLLPFVAIDSETDALPFGEMRKHWQPAALAMLQSEIDEKEAWARKFGEAHCRNLVDRFSE
jgi:hypothetical protein